MKDFYNNIINLYGANGQQWLTELPTLLNKIEQQLSIKLAPAFDNLTFHFVAPAIDHHGHNYVLKCGFPDNTHQHEINMLQWYDGVAAVQLHDHDHSKAWLLLQHCQPGTSLTSLENDDEATLQATQLIQQLAKPANDKIKLSSIHDWLEKLNNIKPRDLKDLPLAYCQNARDMSEDLLQSQGKRVVLHGDLHHDNILKSDSETWLAIDPKGVIGELEYEFGALLRNPPAMLENPHQLTALLQRRLKLISEISGLDYQRLLHWAYIQAVLAAYWCVEDNLAHYEPLLYCASCLYKMV